MNVSPVHITGLGCISAAGTTLDRCMKSMYSGERNPSAPTLFDVDLQKSYPVFEVCEDVAGLVPESLCLGRSLTRTSRLALIAASEALHHAGLAPEQLSRARVGVCLGTTVGCTLNNEPFYRAYCEGKRPGLEPLCRFLDNNPALLLAEVFGCKGAAACIANACSAGTDAIGLAKSWIESGQCDIVIAGGTDEVCRVTYLGFISLMVASTQPCKPFDRERTGLNLGEGAGIMVLEREEHVRERNAESLGEVCGYGCSADAFHPTGPHPEGEGLRRAITTALNHAGIDTAQVGCINAHGTSTPDNDKVEGSVIADMFSPDTPVVSTKSYTGHTLGAAGGIEAAFSVRALQEQRVPPTAGFSEPDLDCTITPTQKTTELNTEYAMSNSLAFGGTNSVLVFRRRR